MAHNWFYVSGGADRVFFETMKLLQEHGHDVIPFSMKNPKNYDSIYKEYFVDEIDYKSIKPSIGNLKTALKMIYSLDAKKKMDTLIQKTRPDIVHLHNIYGRLTPSILYALKKNKVPAVMTLHDYKLICPSYSMLRNGKVCEFCKGGKYYRCLITRCHKNSYLASLVYVLESYLYAVLKAYFKYVEYFIVPSKFMRNKFIEFGFPGEKLVYIPNFVTSQCGQIECGNGSYLLYFGKLLRTKGLLTLFKAVSEIPDANLLVAGPGDMKDELEKYVKENKIGNIKFLGHLEKEELHKVLKQASFVIIPSECYENAPLAVLEAFAYGKPVIGANIGGIPEMVIDGETGMLFEPGNFNDLKEKIGFCISHRKMISEMGKKAREKIQKSFNAELHYQRLIEVYTKVLGSKY